MSDPQAVQEEIDAYVASLLNLVGIEADPLSSREHILLSTIINDAWSQDRALDLPPWSHPSSSRPCARSASWSWTPTTPPMTG